MKFGNTVLLAIVDVVRQGLTEGKDISQLLRDLDVEVDSSTDRIELAKKE